MSNVDSALMMRWRPRRAWLVGLIAALSLSLVPGVADANGGGSAKGKKKGKGQEMTVMTRNAYLGGDLRPLVESSGVDEAINLGGQIVNQVYATKFPSVRARLLAKEILKQRPDVVGLQEVAQYRTGPVDLAAITNPSATQLDPQAGDFMPELLKQLKQQRKKFGKKKGKKGVASAAAKRKSTPPKYRLVVLKPELDAELPVNNGSGGLAAANRDIRLTQHDAILVRKGVKVSNPTSGTYNVLLRVLVGGILPVDVTRGWTAVDVKVHGRKFHVVNTHLEAFDDQASNNANNGLAYPQGGIRQAQAQQLVGSGGPANQKNTILVGDLNSNFPAGTGQVAGDTLAFQAVLAGGFSKRAISPPPFSCCISDPLLAVASPVGVDHVVDHILANSKKIRFRKGAVTSSRGSGLWSSDHFGVASRLLIK